MDGRVIAFAGGRRSRLLSAPACARTASQCDPNPRRPPDVPADADLVMELELVSCGPIRALEELTLAERVAKASRKRMRGNELYGRKDVHGALSAYNRGLKILDSAPPEDDPTAVSAKEAADRERAQLLSNQALCLWKAGDLGAAAASCELGLALNPTNAKLLYRGAAVLAELNELDAAAARLQKLLALEPANADGLALRRHLQDRRAKQRAADRELYGRMLSKDAGLYDDMPMVAPPTAAASGDADDSDHDSEDTPLAMAAAKATASWARTVLNYLLANPHTLISLISVVVAAVVAFIILPLTTPKETRGVHTM